MNEIKTTKTFLTFGGGSDNYRKRLINFTESVKQSNVFDRIIGINDYTLKTYDDFWPKHSKFLEENKRGYGYWLWKSYLIKRTLSELKSNDILVYCDAGCMFNPDGIKRLNEYFDMVNKSKYGILSFQMKITEKLYTKRALFEYFRDHLDEIKNCTPINTMTSLTKENCIRFLENTYQNMATVIIIRKTEHSVNFFNKLYEIASIHDLINDKRTNEIKEFVDHRHDQSIYSLLCKTIGSTFIPDETFFHPNWYVDGAKYPFWATRIRS
jgi:hypothetical protein